MQHELSHRPLERPGRARRSLVRDDAARPEPRRRPSSPSSAGVPVKDVKNVAIWGNHSATQFPDFANATIGGKPAHRRDHRPGWLQGDFITTVQKRGAAVIEARGLSSAASAANAAIDTVASLVHRDAERRLRLGRGDEPRRVRRARRSDLRLPRACPTAQDRGRSRRTSIPTTSPRIGSRSPPTNCCPNVTRSSPSDLSNRRNSPVVTASL